MVFFMSHKRWRSRSLDFDYRQGYLLTAFLSSLLVVTNASTYSRVSKGIVPRRQNSNGGGWTSVGYLDEEMLLPNSLKEMYRLPRQAPPPMDDEDTAYDYEEEFPRDRLENYDGDPRYFGDYEGSGYSEMKTRVYEFVFGVTLPWRHTYTYRNSNETSRLLLDLERGVLLATNSFPGVKVEIGVVRPLYNGTLSVTAYAEYSGLPSEGLFIERKLKENMINGTLMGVPVKVQLLSFRENKEMCKIEEYKCSEDGRCISKGKQCDGIPDCVGGFDEMDCACPMLSFSCDRGHCLPHYRICDGVFDCLDHSDEHMNCQYLKDGEISVMVIPAEVTKPIRLECRIKVDGNETAWSVLGGYMPTDSSISGTSLSIESVDPGDAGMYKCQHLSSHTLTLLDVKGIIPRFNATSSLELAVFFKSTRSVVIEVSFKPLGMSGLILSASSGEQYGTSSRLLFGLGGGYPLVEYSSNKNVQQIFPPEELMLNTWHTVVITINDIGAFMIIDGESMWSSVHEFEFEGHQLNYTVTLGASQTKFNSTTNFGALGGTLTGCISRLVVDGTAVDFKRDTISKAGITTCDVCSARSCPVDGICYEANEERGHECICPTHSPDGTCNLDSICYEGACGSGRCLNMEEGLKCNCPFGRAGDHCKEKVTVAKPSFNGWSSMVLRSQKGLESFSLEIDFTTEVLDNVILVDVLPTNMKSGGHITLSISDGRLVLGCDSRDTVESLSIYANDWINVKVDVTKKLCSLTVNGKIYQTTALEVQRRFDFQGLLYIGDGFIGCIQKLKLMDEEVHFVEEVIFAVNVTECEGPKCKQNLCGERSKCFENSTAVLGYTCICDKGYRGPGCEFPCSVSRQCRNGGTCEDNFCVCPLGFFGHMCEQVKECPFEERTVLGHVWILNTTLIGNTLKVPCPANFQSGYGVWTCNNDTNWDETPDLSDCRNHQDLFLVSNDTDLAWAADNLTALASNIVDGNLAPGDLLKITEGIQFLQAKHTDDDVNENEVDAHILSERYTDALVNVTSMMLEEPETWHFMPEEKIRESSTILQESLVEASLTEIKSSTSDVLLNYSHNNTDLRLISQPRDYFIRKENRLYQHTSFMDTKLLLPEYFYENQLNDSREEMEDEDDDDDERNSENDDRSDEKVAVVFNSFENLHCLLNDIPCSHNSSVPSEGVKAQVNSGVIGATVGFGRMWKAGPNKYVELNFSHIHNGSSCKIGNVKCSWWDTETNQWSVEGCQLIETNDFFTICHCDHLTNLAVIMDLRGLLNRDTNLWKALKWITILGCSSSILCLAVGVYCFWLLKTAREKKKSTTGAKKYMIRLHLCLSLLFAEFVLLLGLDATENKIICTIVAAVLHFFFLTTFTWSAIESFNLYLAMKKVFESPISQKHFLIAGYGIPTLLVGSSLVITRTNGYGTPHACWLSPSGIIWSFAGTLAFIMLINAVAFGMVMRIVWARKHSVGASARSNTFKPKLRKVIGSIAIFLVLGLTWITGFFFLAKASKVLAVVFTLLNSLQGASIFFFGIIFEEDVRKELQTLFSEKLQDQKMPSAINNAVAKFKKRQDASHESGASEVEVVLQTQSTQASHSTDVKT